MDHPNQVAEQLVPQHHHRYGVLILKSTWKTKGDKITFRLYSPVNDIDKHQQ